MIIIIKSWFKKFLILESLSCIVKDGWVDQIEHNSIVIQEVCDL